MRVQNSKASVRMASDQRLVSIDIELQREGCGDLGSRGFTGSLVTPKETRGCWFSSWRLAAFRPRVHQPAAELS